MFPLTSVTETLMSKASSASPAPIVCVATNPSVGVLSVIVAAFPLTSTLAPVTSKISSLAVNVIVTISVLIARFADTEFSVQRCLDIQMQSRCICRTGGVMTVRAVDVQVRTSTIVNRRVARLKPTHARWNLFIDIA